MARTVLLYIHNDEETEAHNKNQSDHRMEQRKAEPSKSLGTPSGGESVSEDPERRGRRIESKAALLKMA